MTTGFLLPLPHWSMLLSKLYSSTSTHSTQANSSLWVVTLVSSSMMYVSSHSHHDSVLMAVLHWTTTQPHMAWIPQLRYQDFQRGSTWTHPLASIEHLVHVRAIRQVRSSHRFNVASRRFPAILLGRLSVVRGMSLHIPADEILILVIHVDSNGHYHRWFRLHAFFR